MVIEMRDTIICSMVRYNILNIIIKDIYNSDYDGDFTRDNLGK